MHEEVTKEALAEMGGPNLVYVRSVSAAEVIAETELPPHIQLDPEAILYAVHSADGSRLAVLDDRSAAFAAARGQELEPVSVH